MKLKSLFKRQATRFVAIVLIVVLYGFAQLPKPSEAERDALAARFSFTQLPLPELPGYTPKAVRAVHPSLAHISAWISTVGAAVALSDLDGDGISNDVCYVDARIDQVVVAPVPGTTQRYVPFALDLTGLSYDPNTMAPMGCLPGDLNEDGATDLLVYYWGRTPVAFLNRASSGDELDVQSYRPSGIGVIDQRWYSNAATLADLDGDGHLDLVIGNYFQDDARILDTKAVGQEQMQHSMSRAFNGGQNRLLLWSDATESTVRFTDVEGVLDERTSRGWTLAVGAADLDGDLLPELYFANDFGPDRLLHNRSRPGQLRFAVLEGEKTFTTPNSKVLGRDSHKGMGVDFGDLNGDGILDIYVSNIAAEYALQESHFVWMSTGQLQRMQEGIAPYVDRSEPLGLSRSGWGWEARLADFDNDGTLEAVQATGFVKGQINRWPELHELAIGSDELISDPRSWSRLQPGDDLSGHQHNPFFVRGSDGRFVDIARELGLGAAQVTRGIAIADVDGDGDLDFAVANQWEPSSFYRNECPDCGMFLGLHLLLPLQPGPTTTRPGHPNVDTPGRPAIGAQATVHLPDGRTLVAHVDGGNGHSGVRSPELHFGLGELPDDSQLQVELRWRDPQGQPQRQTLRLAPGWHTVLLGWLNGEEAQ